jgi:hypothetical protein
MILAQYFVTYYRFRLPLILRTDLCAIFFRSRRFWPLENSQSHHLIPLTPWLGAGPAGPQTWSHLHEIDLLKRYSQ